MSNKQQDNSTEDRYEFRGVKIAHELMVDILGGLIPGALFLFSIILCVVFPIICYANPNNHFGFLLKDGDWFWIVAFLSFLILSYVIGHIFHRADIKEPDRVDIRREQKKKLKAFIDGMPVNKEQKIKRLKYAANLLYGEVKPLADALNHYSRECNRHPYDSDFNKCCEETAAALVKLINDSIPSITPKLRQDILCVLFPEAINNFKDSNGIQDRLNLYYPNNKKRALYYTIARRLFPEIDKLPFRSRAVLINAIKIVPLVDNHTGWVVSRIWRRIRMSLRLHMINNNSLFEHLRLYRTKWDADIDNTNNDSPTEESFNILMVAYLILHMQNESGCATEKRCDFPYMSYYKYLLKRKQFDLLEYADWATSSARTKNQINKYKIELQLYVPDAYSIISKNESHIRMASSAWHVAKTIKAISWIMIFVMSALAVLAGIYHEKVGFQNPEDYNLHEHTFKYNSQTNNENLSIRNSIKSLANDNKSSNDAANKSKYVKIINTHFPFIARETTTNSYFAVFFPIVSLLMALYIIKNVPRFIHYQRLREIYYTLRVYKLWRDAVSDRERKDKENLNIRRASVGLPPLPEVPPMPPYFD